MPIYAWAKNYKHSFILDVTISHIITVKSLIVVIRKPSFFGGDVGQV